MPNIFDWVREANALNETEQHDAGLHMLLANKPEFWVLPDGELVKCEGQEPPPGILNHDQIRELISSRRRA